MQAELGRLVLKRVLLLALLLDRAIAACRGLQATPLLFVKEATVKSSAQVLRHPPAKLAACNSHVTSQALATVL